MKGIIKIPCVVAAACLLIQAAEVHRKFRLNSLKRMLLFHQRDQLLIPKILC